MSTEQSGTYILRAGTTFYIGSAANISKRWYKHRKALEEGTHYNKSLQKAYARHSVTLDIQYLGPDYRKKEQELLDRLKGSPGCANECPLATSTKGRPTSDRTRELHRLRYRYEAIHSPAARLKRVATARANGTLARKLSVEDVLTIRHRYANRVLRPGSKTRCTPSLQSLADEYGLAIATVHQIVRKEIWTDV